jgi:hypothetical protein
VSTGSWIAIWLPVMLVLYLLWVRKNAILHHNAAENCRKKGGKPPMEEIIQKLMGEKALVTTIEGTETGILSRYVDGWITLTDKKGNEKYLNGDYIVKIKKTK